MQVALVTGIGGQDGYYLARLLQTKGYSVVGLVHSREDMEALEQRLPEVSFVRGDVTRSKEIAEVLERFQPDEVYNLAGFSFPPASIADPVEAWRVNATGALNVLEATRALAASKPDVRLYQASTSEMFGRSQTPPYDEATPLRPETPYAASKAGAHHLVASYRTQFGLFAVCGILFNHESPFRPPHYVTRKVSSGVAEISLGLRDSLDLGDLGAMRDWGFAGDYVEGMWLMMQNSRPEDFVLATGVGRSVEELVDTAFGAVGIGSWKSYVNVSPELVRPPEENSPIGNPEKATRVLGWKAGTSFEELVAEMVETDLERLRTP